MKAGGKALSPASEKAIRNPNFSERERAVVRYVDRVTHDIGGYVVKVVLNDYSLRFDVRDANGHALANALDFLWRAKEDTRSWTSYATYIGNDVSSVIVCGYGRYD